MKSIFKKTIVTILRFEAKHILNKYQPRIIAVTGSVGKTSTKDAIYSVLAGSEHVRKSDKSFNSEIGLPLTIIGAPNAWSNPLRWLQTIFDGLLLILVPTNYPKWLVLEVGADRPGDISSLASWLRVDIAVITRLPEVPVHVEYFSSPEKVVEEKASLINALKQDGTLVVFADDRRVEMLTKKAKDKGAQVITFGLSEAADVRTHDFSFLLEERASHPNSKWPIGMRAILTVGDVSAPIAIVGIVGTHLMLSVAAAAAVGRAMGKRVEEMVSSLSSFEPPRGRMRLLPGLKGSLIIDDTYNSSPAAVEAALVTLGQIKKAASAGKTHVRCIAVLGDMLELGRHSVEEHKKVGAIAAPQVDLLVTVGFRARDIAQGALDAGMPEESILQFENSARAGEELQALVEEPTGQAGIHDVVLVKGSQSIRTEKIVERLMLEPEAAPDVLVRQEANWRKR